MINDAQDAFGHAILDFHLRGQGFEIIERDDGLFNLSKGPGLYFSRYPDWPREEQKAIRYAGGRVLDIGCGAGRHALYLQEKGFEVLGIDNSPNAIRVCKARGLRQARVLAITQVSRRLGVFDTVLMLGNNFGLVGNERRARWLLRRLAGMTSEQSLIIAATRDPHKTVLPDQAAYHARNRARGRWPGQARIRVRYKKYVTPWLDLLMVSVDELRRLLRDTGWEIAKTLRGEEGRYIAILEKARSKGIRRRGVA